MFFEFGITGAGIDIARGIECVHFWLLPPPRKRLKLILKFYEIMPLYRGGAFRCGDNGLIHSISFKPVVDFFNIYLGDKIS